MGSAGHRVKDWSVAGILGEAAEQFRHAVQEEQHTLAGLQEQYLTALRDVYGPEIGADTALSRQSKMEIQVPRVERPKP